MTTTVTGHSAGGLSDSTRHDLLCALDRAEAELERYDEMRARPGTLMGWLWFAGYLAVFVGIWYVAVFVWPFIGAVLAIFGLTRLYEWWDRRGT